MDSKRAVSDPLPHYASQCSLAEEFSALAASTALLKGRPRVISTGSSTRAGNKKGQTYSGLGKWAVGIKGGPAIILPVGTTRPVPFSIHLLDPQTHKVSVGQLAILPSRTLLIDFREGERRHGERGDEVLLVEDGSLVKVYSAPHLSTPCCLIDPIAEYTLDNLPKRYWKIYNDAARLVEKIKQRTPKMTLHTPEAYCTLMANGTYGDIELTLPPPPRSISVSRPHHGRNEDHNPTMRIRLSRARVELEIARHVPPTQFSDPMHHGKGGEWTKRIMHFSGSPSQLEGMSTRGDEGERKALQCLARFVCVCEALECEEINSEGGAQAVPPASHPPSSILGAHEDSTNGGDDGGSETALSSPEETPRQHPPRLIEPLRSIPQVWPSFDKRRPKFSSRSPSPSNYSSSSSESPTPPTPPPARPKRLSVLKRSFDRKLPPLSMSISQRAQDRRERSNAREIDEKGKDAGQGCGDMPYLTTCTPPDLPTMRSALLSPTPSASSSSHFPLGSFPGFASLNRTHSPTSDNPTPKGKQPTLASSRSTDSPRTRPLQTAYLPSIGWCVRHGSRVSQGGRYTVVFRDGAVLGVDADEGWVEFRGPGGRSGSSHNIDSNGRSRYKEDEGKRYAPGEGGRAVAERMRAFGEFLSLFEQDSSGS